MAISDIVTIDITVQDAVPATVNFSTPLILTAEAGLGNAGPVAKRYDASSEGLAALVADGYEAGGPAHRKLSAIVSQQQHVTDVVVARRLSTPVAHTFTLTPNAAAVARGGQPFSITAGVNEATPTVCQTYGGTPTVVATVCTALAAALTALTGVTATSSGTSVTVTCDDVDGSRVFSKNVVNLDFADTTADAGIAADLAAAQAALDVWYGIVLTATSVPEIEAAAAWAEANGKMLLALSHDSAVGTAATNDIASTLKSQTRHRTALWWTRDGYGQVDAAITGRQLSLPPVEASNFAGKILSGPIADAWTASEKSYAEWKSDGTGKNANLFVPYDGSISHTLHGRAASGRPLDLTFGLDWLRAEMQSAIAFVWLNNERVPYTDAGIALYEAAVRSVLARAERTQFLTNVKVTVPRAADATVSDKAARVLRGLNWSATAGGGINKVVVQGTVSL